VPYVCNACPTIDKCTLLKTFYDAEKAHLKSHQVISESRSGLSTSEEEIARLNRIISPLVKQGHSIHEIYITHQDELMCSEKTIYNYIDDCLLEVRNIDLPRKVRFRSRRKKPEFKVDKGCRIGRSYKEFEAFMEKNPDTAVVQMDSVIGTVGGKCLLTIHFVESSLMLAFLRDANTSQSVINIYDKLDKDLGAKLFDRLFPVIVTDNGSEFSNPKKIEYREVKSTTAKRYLVYADGKPKLNESVTDPSLEYELDDFNGGKFPFVPKQFKYLNLAVGYSQNRDTAIVEVEKITFTPDKIRANMFCYWIEEFHISRVVEVHRK
jgi:hypothetical protein